MDDAVTRYCAASEVADIDTMMSTLGPEAELVSPLSGRMVFRGRDDVRLLLTAVYGGLRGLRWSQPVGDGGPIQYALADARVGGLRLGDAMVFELGDDGLIHRIRPHLRPWLATTMFALMLGPKVARHPGVVWRALRAGIAAHR